MHKRHPQCGCDCRHTLVVADDKIACCEECSGGIGPWRWHVYLPCQVTCDGECIMWGGFAPTPDSDPLLYRGFDLYPWCLAGGNCLWLCYKALEGHGSECPGMYVLSGNGDEYTNFPFSGDWVRSGATDPDDFAWRLTIVGGVMALEWDHPTYGLMKYESTEAVVCDGNNTLTLVESGTATCLPGHVCVYPGTGDRRCGCGNNEPCPLDWPAYDTTQDYCQCCDPACEWISPQPLFITCGACSESTTVTPTVGGGNGLDGVSSPSGQTYGACATLCGKEICGNWYCSAGQWKLDGYIDGVFCGTGDLTHECCPLSLGTTTLSGCSPSGCDVCVGDGCITCTDCPGTAMPSVLYASDGMTTWTLTYDAGLGYWQDTTARDGLGCTGQTAVVQCTGTGIYFALAPSGQSCYASVNTCDPFDADCTFFGCDAATYSLSITA